MISLIYFKLSNYCNVGCKHCYLTGKQRKDFYFMTKEDIKNVFDKLENFFLKQKEKIRPAITLHGGEPLLVDFEVIEYFIKIFSEKGYPLSIQTSLFPLFKLNNEERKKYYELFKKYNVSVSSSYDFFGIRQYKGSYEKFNEKFLEIVNELNDFDLKPYMMFTITKKMQNREKEVYEWLLKNYHLFSGISYEEYNEYHTFNKFLYLKNSEISEILIKFYSFDKKNNFKIFKKYFYLKESLNNLEKLPGKFCTNCQETYLVIDPDGEITNCPDKAGMETFGNIFKEELEKILKNKLRLQWILTQRNSLSVCKDCEFNKICKGGCPLKKDLFKKQNKFNTKEECPGFYNFLKYIKENG